MQQNGLYVDKGYIATLQNRPRRFAVVLFIRLFLTMITGLLSENVDEEHERHEDYIQSDTQLSNPSLD
jgi:hypothetical protein